MQCSRLISEGGAHIIIRAVLRCANERSICLSEDVHSTWCLAHGNIVTEVLHTKSTPRTVNGLS